ncbi:MAG: DUF2071 domain-containing protein [Kofleriaceae bacterium]
MSDALVPAPPLTMSTRSFLTAEWRHLCLFTYAVAPERLARLLPPGLALDTVDGEAFVSLVAFDFLRTRVLGVPWPGYRDFPEINLRFYVREGERRGVAFVRELVPKRLVAWLARLLYNEPYAYAPMRSEVRELGGSLEVEHTLRAGGRTQRLWVRARAQAQLPAEDSREHFFKEHSWGYGRSRRGELNRYEVRHPVWEIFPVERYELDWDFGATYGAPWGELTSARPSSVVLARGSAVRVSPLG